ncbi:MAG: hypothetical protein LBC42_00995 [Puniceicoccales bacterium]|nr:hypothetical protein [Puniceicoccales bacterium]
MCMVATYLIKILHCDDVRYEHIRIQIFVLWFSSDNCWAIVAFTSAYLCYYVPFLRTLIIDAIVMYCQRLRHQSVYAKVEEYTEVIEAIAPNYPTYMEFLRADRTYQWLDDHIVALLEALFPFGGTGRMMSFAELQQHMTTAHILQQISPPFSIEVGIDNLCAITAFLRYSTNAVMVVSYHGLSEDGGYIVSILAVGSKERNDEHIYKLASGSDVIVVIDTTDRPAEFYDTSGFKRFLFRGPLTESSEDVRMA